MIAKIFELTSFLIIVGVVGIIIMLSDPYDPNTRLSKIKSWIDRTFRLKCLQNRYAITRVLLLIGAILGVCSMVLTW